MTRYTHPSLEDFISPAPFTLDEIRYPAVWWRTATEQEIAALGFIEYVPPPQPPFVASPSDINAERDRRVAAGTTVNVTGYGDIPLQGGERDQTNLLGLVTAAQVRLAGGDTSTLTKFRDADNVDHMLTPMQIIEMWSKGAAWISANYDASWALKAMDPIPADFADDSYWP